jgi:hypothetical protein
MLSGALRSGPALVRLKPYSEKLNCNQVPGFQKGPWPWGAAGGGHGRRLRGARNLGGGGALAMRAPRVLQYGGRRPAAASGGGAGGVPARPDAGTGQGGAGDAQRDEAHMARSPAARSEGRTEPAARGRPRSVARKHAGRCGWPGDAGWKGGKAWARGDAHRALVLAGAALEEADGVAAGPAVREQATASGKAPVAARWATRRRRRSAGAEVGAQARAAARRRGSDGRHGWHGGARRRVQRGWRAAFWREKGRKKMTGAGVKRR